MEDVERLAALFHGLERAHGVYEQGAKNSKGKYEGRAYTRREPWTIEHWIAHLEGKVGLGIVPIDDDGMCSWGCIDIDEYPLDEEAINEVLRKYLIPVVCCYSKSLGGHLYLFMKYKVTCIWMIEQLNKIKAVLSRPNAEGFPKQKKLANREDVGNWLNMPYFGNERRMWGGHDLGYFLDYAESMKQDPEDVERILDAMVLPDEDPETQMPPCLQIIARDGAPEGTRNKFMFNMGVFLKKAYGNEELEDRLYEANRNVLSEPLPHHEVATLAKSLSRDKDYFYQCKDVPLCNNCDKQTCKTRKYGIGGGSETALSVKFNGLEKVCTDPPIWYLDVDGYRVEISTADMFSFAMIKQRCADVLTKHVGIMKQSDWELLVSGMLENCTIVEMPEESGVIGAFKAHVNDFLCGGAVTTNKDDMLNGRPWYNEHEGRYYFRLHDLMSHLEGRKFRAYTQAQVSSKLRTLEAQYGQFYVRGQFIRWWAMPQLYAAQTEAFETETFKVPMQ